MPRPPYSRYDDHPDTPTATPAANLGAHLSDHDTLHLTIPADDTLSACWGKACDFARNFGTTHISVELLLLGACHVRDAEPVLAETCDSVEALSNALTAHCAKRSFATMPHDMRAYTANKTLKSVLCRAAALAASQEMARISLSLLLAALREYRPRLPVMDHLSAPSPRQPEEEQLIADLSARLDALHRAIMGTNDGQTAHALPLAPTPTLADAIAKLMRDVSLLRANLLYFPSGPVDSSLEPHLNVPTTSEFHNLLRLFQERLVPLVAEAVVQQITLPSSRALVPVTTAKRTWWPFRTP